MIARAIMVTWLVLLVVLVGRWWQQRDGRVHVRAGSASPGEGSGIASAVLVSTPTCRTCPEVRAVLDEVAAATTGFTWEEVDAASDLAFVRAHDVMRAPTVLFRDTAGAVVARAAGAIGHDEVAATVGSVPTPAVG